MKVKTCLRLAYILSDYLTVTVGWLVFNIMRFYTLPVGYSDVSLSEFLWHFPQVVAGELLIPPMMVVLYALSGFYNEMVFKSRLDDINNTLAVSTFGALIIYFVVLVNDSVPERMRIYETLLILIGLLSVPTMLARMTVTGLRRRHSRSRGGVFKAIILGAPAEARRIADTLARSSDAGIFDIVGTVAPDEAEPDHISELALRTGAQAVIAVLPAQQSTEMLPMLYRSGLQIYITPDVYSVITSRPRMSKVVGEPLVDITNANLPPSTQNFKRVGDAVISLVALVALAPVMAAIAIAIKADSAGPVFYRQERVGYHRRRFHIIKFRTMRPDSEPDGPALSSPDDRRVTRVGRFLRKYRLDELPQFWNVLIGQMSLVGPRPEREYYAALIGERVPYYSLIHQVRPGITSWGMVKYGYATNVDQMVERLRYDLMYVENVSLTLDIKILFHTVNTVITGRGV